MRITDVTSFRIPLPGAKPAFVWRRGLLGSSPDGEAAVLRIGTDEGVAGVALASRPGMAAAVEDMVARVLREALTGQDPLQREWLWHLVWELDRTEEFPLPVLGLVDTALWDLAGRLSGQPVWQVLGGFRTKIPAYASTVTFHDIDEYLDVATQCLELGPLMYDGSAGFDLPDATYLGQALHDTGFLWYEEPMREFSVTAYGHLARSVRIPLLVAETSDGAHLNSAAIIANSAASPPARPPSACGPARRCAAASPGRCGPRTWPTRSGCARRCSATRSRAGTWPWRSPTPPTTSR